MMMDHPSRSLPVPVLHPGAGSGSTPARPHPLPHPRTVLTTTSYCPIKDIAVMHNRFFPDTFPNTLTTTTLQSRRTASKLPALYDSGSGSTPGSTENPLSPSCRSSSVSGASSPPQTPNAGSAAAPQSTSAELPAPVSPAAPAGPNSVASTNSSTKLKLKLTNQFFNEKSDIKPWLQSRLSSLGINIVIERSDDTKIVFKCKYSFSQPLGSSSSTSGAANSPSNRKKKFCPFRIRANYSIRLKHWSLVIVNDSHNHPLPLVNIEDVQDKLSERHNTDCNNSTDNTSHNNAENGNNYTHSPNPTIDAAEEERQHPTKRVKRSKSSSRIAFSPLPLPPSTTISAAAQDGSSVPIPQKTSPMLTLSSEMTRKSSGSVDSLLNTENNSSSNIPNKLPPLTSCTQLPANNMDYHLRQPHFLQPQHLDPAYRIQVKRIEDTLKGLEKIDSITEDSKEKIFSNVLSVLNNSISEAAKPAVTVLASPLSLAHSNSSAASSSSSLSSSSSIPAFNLGKLMENPPSLHSPSLGSSSTHQSFKYTPAPLHTHIFDSSSQASAPLSTYPHASGKFGETIILPSLDVLKRGLDNNADLDNHAKPHNNHLTISLGYNNGIGKEYT